MIGMILRYALIAVAAGVIGFAGWTAYGEMTQSASANMSESVQLAQTQAQSMNQALAKVSAIGTAGQQPDSQSAILPQSNPAQDVAPKSFKSIDGSETPLSASQRQYIEPADVSEITDLDTLIAVWRPRYDTAEIAYVKFSASIDSAKSQAAEYFAQQQAITMQIRNPENQAIARQEDEYEMSLYRQWEEQADSALRMAAEIGIQLDDMDANLRKMELRADFVFDTSAFQEVPEAISNLNRQLVDFHAASENIKAATGSPFEAR